MAASGARVGARVIDLEEYRRRRASRAERESSMRSESLFGNSTLCVWYPVWYWVPIVPGV
jgi:3-methyladenine DNA glycosylase Mpg